jgi:isopenicillin-N epimerase
VGAAQDDLAFVPNATAGVNAVLRSLVPRLAAGDELVVTDHEYQASRNTLDFVAALAGARVVVARVPFPLTDAGQVVEAVLGAVGPRTRLALLDHVTSPTGLVLPVERLVPALAERGIDTLVDGAHGPGMVPLHLDALGAAYYTGNCHKWLCAPKGSAFLWVRRDRQEGLRPLSISHGASSTRQDRSRFQLEFGWTGTCDPTPWLCVPAALRHLGALLPGGWPAIMAHNRSLALEARGVLCQALGVAPPCPDGMLGSLVSLPLPPLRLMPEPRPGDPRISPLAPGPDPLQDELLFRHGFELPIIPWPAAPSGRLMRVSAQLYKDVDEYRRLAELLAGWMGE